MPAEEERPVPRGQIGHTSSDCTNEPKCPNCTGNHSAFSKSCPEWLFEKRVQQVKAEKGISFIKARKIVSAEREGRSAQGGHTAVAVVASMGGPTQPVTRSIEVQTDLTWPKGQDVPSFSLPLQAQPPNVQLKLLYTNSQATPLVVHKPLANGSPVRILPLLHRATKTILINLTASPPIRRKRSLDLLSLPSLFLRSQ